jgi:hypothetical protein
MTEEFEARLIAAVAVERERFEALLSSEARAYRAEAFCASETTARVKVDCMAAAIEGVLRKWRAQTGKVK